MRGVNPLSQVTQDMLKMMLASVKLRVTPHTRVFAEDCRRRKGEDDAHGSLNTILKAGIAAQQLSSGFARDLLPSASWTWGEEVLSPCRSLLCDLVLDSSLRVSLLCLSVG